MLNSELQTWAVPLDPLQRAAASDDNRVKLILGDSGTGKSQVLIAEVLDLLKNGVNPGSILYFTCTALAEWEVRRLVQQSCLNREGARKIFVGSLLEYSSWYLWNGRARIAVMPRRFTMWDQEKAIRATQLAWCDLGEVPVKLSVLKGALRWHSDCRSNWPSEPEIPPDDNRWAAIARVYERLKSRYNAMDADDLVSQTAEVIGDGERQGRTSGRHIFVDGLESIKPSEFRLLMLIRGDGDRFVAAADPMQRCRSIGGRDPGTVQRLYWENRALGLHRLRLDHVSSSELWSLGNGLLDNCGQQREDKQRSVKGGAPKGRSVLVEVEAGIPEMHAHAVDEAARLVRSGAHSYAEMAFLYRDGHTIKGLRTFLIHRDIPIRVFGEDRKARISDTYCALNLLACVLNPNDIEAVRVAAGHSWPGRERILGKSASTALMRSVERHGPSVIDAAARLSRDSGVEESTRRDLRNLANWHDELKRCLTKTHSELPEIFDRALHLVRSARGDSGLDQEEPDTGEVKELCRMLAAPYGYDVLMRIGRLLDLVSPALRPDRTVFVGGGLTCSTLECSRGMRWPVVFILDVRDSRIPGRPNSSGSTTADELGLLYIGLKRAN